MRMFARRRTCATDPGESTRGRDSEEPVSGQCADARDARNSYCAQSTRFETEARDRADEG